nr:hypothetical protein [Tanacetum cinerariifolium]
MLDSYTSNMCLNLWGRSAYARALIEIAADVELVKSLVVAILFSNKEGHTFATIDIEYEWTPPRCATCCIFDHAVGITKPSSPTTHVNGEGSKSDCSFASLLRPHAISNKSPIILSKWSPSVSLKRGKVTKVLVWVKLYNVPVLAYSEDGLSLLGTQIGKPVMLDAFTSSMCVESWGRISFARALIEIDAAVGLKKEVIMAILEEEGDSYIKEKKGADAKSNSKSPCASSNVVGNDQGVSNPGLNTSNPFDVLNVDGD